MTSAHSPVYLDASALVKLILPEAESAALGLWLDGVGDVWASSLVLAEVPQAVRRGDPGREARTRSVLDHVSLVPLDDPLLRRAGALGDGLRTFDAIHVATALELEDDLHALVTYDRRMAAAATALGVPVVAPT